VASTFADAVTRGYEGVVVKNLAAPYAAGRRDSAWVKIKPRHTFDLIVTAVEWGHAGAGPVICRADASTSTDGRQPMVNQQRLNAVEYEIDLIDQEIVELFAAGYMVEVDRRLDDRRAQQTLRDRLRRGDVPNG